MKRTTAATLIITASLLALGTIGAIAGLQNSRFHTFCEDLDAWTDATLRGELPAQWQKDTASAQHSGSSKDGAASTASESLEPLMTEAVDEREAVTEKTTEAAEPAFHFTAEDHRIIFVGDSRTVGMGGAEAKLGDSCIYIGEVGEGINWFHASGRRQMEDAIHAYPDAPVVMNLGVNDLSLNDASCASQYIALYQSFASAYPDTRFWIMSINPVTQDCANVTNTEITQFNDALRGAFPDQFLDTFKLLKKEGFETPDGIHYTNATYTVIHDYVVKELASILKRTETSSR